MVIIPPSGVYVFTVKSNSPDVSLAEAIQESATLRDVLLVGPAIIIVFRRSRWCSQADEVRDDNLYKRVVRGGTEKVESHEEAEVEKKHI